MLSYGKMLHLQCYISSILCLHFLYFNYCVGETIISHDHVLNFGISHFWDYCPPNTLANGFEVKTDREEKNFSDEEGMTGIRLYCSDQNEVERRVIGSYSLPSGKWKGKNTCHNGEWLTGFRVRIQDYGGFARDDTAANDVDMSCNATYSYSGHGNRRGSWTEWSNCPKGEVICGVQTQVEDIFTPDRVGLVALQFKCCDSFFNGSYVEEGNKSLVEDVLFPPEANSFPLPTLPTNSNNFPVDGRRTTRNSVENVTKSPNSATTLGYNLGIPSLIPPFIFTTNETLTQDPTNSRTKNETGDPLNPNGTSFTNKSIIFPNDYDGKSTPFLNNTNNTNTRDFVPISIDETATKVSGTGSSRNPRNFQFDIFNNSRNNIFISWDNRNKSWSYNKPSINETNFTNSLNPNSNIFNNSGSNIFVSWNNRNKTWSYNKPTIKETNFTNPFNPNFSTNNSRFDFNSTSNMPTRNGTNFTNSLNPNSNIFNNSGSNIFVSWNNRNKTWSYNKPTIKETNFTNPFNPNFNTNNSRFDFNSTSNIPTRNGKNFPNFLTPNSNNNNFSFGNIFNNSGSNIFVSWNNRNKTWSYNKPIINETNFPKSLNPNSNNNNFSFGNIFNNSGSSIFVSWNNRNKTWSYNKPTINETNFTKSINPNSNSTKTSFGINFSPHKNNSSDNKSTEKYIPFGLIPVIPPTPATTTVKNITNLDSSTSGKRNDSYIPFGLIPVKPPSSPSNSLEKNNTNSSNNSRILPDYDSNIFLDDLPAPPGKNASDNNSTKYPSTTDSDPKNRTNNGDYIPFGLFPVLRRATSSPNRTFEDNSNNYDNTRTRNGQNSSVTTRTSLKPRKSIFFDTEYNNDSKNSTRTDSNNEYPYIENNSTTPLQTSSIPRKNVLFGVEYEFNNSSKSYVNDDYPFQQYSTTLRMNQNGEDFLQNKNKSTYKPNKQFSTTPSIKRKPTNKIIFIIEFGGNTNYSTKSDGSYIPYNNGSNRGSSSISPPNGNPRYPFFETNFNDGNNDSSKSDNAGKIPSNDANYYPDNRYPTTPSVNNDSSNDIPRKWPFTTRPPNPKFTKNIFVVIHQANRSSTSPNYNIQDNKNETHRTTIAMDLNPINDSFLVTESSNETDNNGKIPYVTVQPPIYPYGYPNVPGGKKKIPSNNIPNSDDNSYNLDPNNSIGGPDFYDLSSNEGKANTARAGRANTSFFKSNGSKSATDPNLATFVMLGLAVTAAIVLSVIGIGYIIKKKRLYKSKVAADPRYKYVISVRHVRPIDPITCE